MYHRSIGYNTTLVGDALIGAANIGNQKSVAMALEQNVGARECSTAWVAAFINSSSAIATLLADHTHPVWVLDALLYEDRFLFDPTVEKNITQVTLEQYSPIVVANIHNCPDPLGLLVSAVILNNTGAVEEILKNNAFTPIEIDVCVRLSLEFEGQCLAYFSQHANAYTDRSIAMMACKHPDRLPQHMFDATQLAGAVLHCLRWRDNSAVVHLLQFGVSEDSVKSQTKVWPAYQNMWDECVAERLRITLHTTVGGAHGVKHKKM